MSSAHSLFTTMVLVGLVACGETREGNIVGSVPRNEIQAKETPVPAVTQIKPATSETAFTGKASYESPIKGILDSTCANCHAQPAAGGAPAWFVLDSYDDVGTLKGVRSLAARIKTRTDDKTMPPNAASMTQTERDLVSQWIAAGAPKSAQAGLSVTLLTPPASGISADASYSVQNLVSGASPNATWSLFYSSQSGATSGGQEIVSGLPTAQSSYTWNTSALAAGSYFLYTVVQDGTHSITAAAPGALTVTHTIAQANVQAIVQANGDATWTYLGDTKSVLDAKCANCHGSPASGGAPSTFVLSSYENIGSLQGVFSKLDRVKARIEDGTMPPVAADLSAGEKTKLLEWIAAGGAKGTSSAPANPRVTFTSPAIASEVAGASYTFQVGFTDVAPADTWDLYVSQVSGDTLGGTPLALGLSVSTTQYFWNTSAVTEGRFYPYAVLRAGGVTKSIAAAGNVFVSHPAGISFVSPSVSGGSANASFAVQLAFQSVASTATWKLYYTTVSGSIAGGTLLGGTRAISSTQVTWDTSALSAGSYFLYAEVTNLGTTTKTASVGGVSVSHPAAGNASPTITVLSPNGAQTLVAGRTAAITYSASDPNSDTLTYKIEISANSGSSWTTLATGQTAQTYTWSIPSNQTQGVTYRVRVTADDGKGGIASDASNADFGIASSSYTYANSVATILSTKCSACHTTGGSHVSRYNASVYSNGTTGAYDLRARMWARVSDDSMPNSPQTSVSASDKETLLLWLWAGGPNVE